MEKNNQVTMDTREAAAYIGTSYWKLLELVKQKKIPCIDLGNRYLFRKESIDRWMDEQEKLSTEYGQVEEPTYGKLRKIY